MISNIPCSTSAADLPPEIWVKIFGFVPPEKRLVIPAVCQPWRNWFLNTPSCWSGIRLGRNANRYSTTPPAFHNADFFPLSHVEEIEFTPTIPDETEYFSEYSVSQHLDETPLAWLRLILQNAVELKSLNLSSTWVAPEDMPVFR